MVTTTYRGIIFDEDTTETVSETSKLTVTPIVTGVIDSDNKVISLYVTSTGEYSSYTFIIDSD